MIELSEALWALKRAESERFKSRELNFIVMLDLLRRIWEMPGCSMWELGGAARTISYRGSIRVYVNCLTSLGLVDAQKTRYQGSVYEKSSLQITEKGLKFLELVGII